VFIIVIEARADILSVPNRLGRIPNTFGNFDYRSPLSKNVTLDLLITLILQIIVIQENFPIRHLADMGYASHSRHTHIIQQSVLVDTFALLTD
jgi:hypothetical protein